MSAANPEAGRRSRTPSANVERELVAAAEAVLVRDGPGGVTVRAVAAEAGIAPMGVYNRLGGKDGLVEALLIIGFDRLRAAVEPGPEPDMMERMRACAMRYREFALTNRHFYAIMFEDAIPHEHISDEVAEHAQAAFGALVRNVEATAAAGRIEAADPREVGAADLERAARRRRTGTQGPGTDTGRRDDLPGNHRHAAPRPGGLSGGCPGRGQPMRAGLPRPSTRARASSTSSARPGVSPKSASPPTELRDRAAARTARSTAGRRAGDRGHACRSSARLADVTAVAALDLAEPAHQVHARADRARVQLRGPVDRRLAGRADQHLAVGPDTALPGALTPVRVDLPCTTPIAGHEVCSDFCRSRRTRPVSWLVQLGQRLLILGDVACLRYGVHDPPPHDAIFINDERAARRYSHLLIEHAVCLRNLAVWPEVGQQPELVVLGVGPRAVRERRVTDTVSSSTSSRDTSGKSSRIAHSSPVQTPLNASG